VRPEKLRLKVRRVTIPSAGENPWPMHGPHADSRMRAPAKISVVNAPLSAIISSTCRLPGVTAIRRWVDAALFEQFSDSHQLPITGVGAASDNNLVDFTPGN